MSQRRIELGIHAERSKRHASFTFVSGIPVFPLSRRWSLSTGETVQVPMIVEKLVESRWKGIDTFQMVIWPAYSFSDYSFDTIVWKYLVTLRNAFDCSFAWRVRVESFNLVLHHTNTESKKKKKKIFKFQNILNNAFDCQWKINIYLLSTIFVIKTQRIFLRYFPVIKILRFDLNSAQLGTSTLKLNYRNEKLLTLRFAGSRWKIQRCRGNKKP